MVPTERLYLRSMHDLEAEARILDNLPEGERTVLILDRSPFHPQGGGQPADQGLIAGAAGTLHVDDVRVVEGGVHHKGALRGVLRPGDQVSCSVDPSRRSFLSRIHSAGHVVDMAVVSLGFDWRPGRGYHFPDGPYVEYEGLTGALTPDETAKALEEEARRLISAGGATSLRFVDSDSNDPALRFIPPGLEAGDQVRVVEFGSFAVPCGGTHVRDLTEIGALQIRRVRVKGTKIRVAYAVSEWAEREVNDPAS